MGSIYGTKYKYSRKSAEKELDFKGNGPKPKKSRSTNKYPVNGGGGWHLAYLAKAWFFQSPHRGHLENMAWAKVGFIYCRLRRPTCSGF